MDGGRGGPVPVGQAVLPAIPVGSPHLLAGNGPFGAAASLPPRLLPCWTTDSLFREGTGFVDVSGMSGTKSRSFAILHWMDGWTDTWTERWTNGQWSDGQTEAGWMGRQVGETSGTPVVVSVVCAPWSPGGSPWAKPALSPGYQMAPTHHHSRACALCPCGWGTRPPLSEPLWE